MSHAVRVVILFQHAEHWINIKSLYDRMFHDDRFEVSIWLVPTLKEANQFRRLSCQVSDDLERMLLEHSKLPFLSGPEIAQAQFDAAIYLTPYDDTRPTEFTSLFLKKRVQHLFYVPYALEIGAGPTSQINQHATAVHQLSSGIFVRSKYSLKSYAQHNPQGANNVYLTGLPLHDELFHIKEFSTDRTLIDEIGGRFPILWNSHYSFDGNIWSTFDVMVKDLFTFAKNRPDIALIWRPHPWTFNVLHKYGVLNDYSESLFLKSLAEWGIVYDRRTDARHVLSVAQGVLTDASSFLLMVLPLDVPVMYLKNPRGRGLLDEGAQLIKAYDVAETPDQAIQFMDTIVRGIDNKRLLRRAIISNHIEKFDGHASDRIAEVIYQTVKKG